jgi:hypothetical protein
MSPSTSVLHWSWGDPAHNREVLGSVSDLLRWRGMPAPEEHGPPGETQAEERLRRLTVLQQYSPGWEKECLERLAPDRLDVAELQIREAAYNAGMDRACEFERLWKAGHDATVIANIFAVDVELVRRWMAPAPGTRR